MYKGSKIIKTPKAHESSDGSLKPTGSTLPAGAVKGHSSNKK